MSSRLDGVAVTIHGHAVTFTEVHYGVLLVGLLLESIGLRLAMAQKIMPAFGFVAIGLIVMAIALWLPALSSHLACVRVLTVGCADGTGVFNAARAGVITACACVAAFGCTVVSYLNGRK